MVNSVTFPSSLGGDDSTVDDGNSPTTGLGNNGHRTRFIPALSQTVIMAQTAVTGASNAAASASTASAAAVDAATSAAAAEAVVLNGAAIVPTWTSGTTWALGQLVVSGVDGKTYRKITATSLTTTDPSSDATNWETLAVVAQTAAQTEFTPTGGLEATNVQAAIAELDTEKIPYPSGSFGTAGQVLTSAGGSNPPTWETVAVATGFEVGDLIVTNRLLSSPEWLRADNSVYLQSAYPSLFSKIGIMPLPHSGVSWSSQISIATAFRCAVYGNNLFVVAGDNGQIYTSPNGATWTARTSGFGSLAILGLVYAGGKFVAVGVNGNVSTSTDGITWTAQTSTGVTLNSVAFGAGVFVAVGVTGRVITSADGVTWTARTYGESVTINDVIYGADKFVSCTSNCTVRTSADGITWTSRSLPYSGVGLRGVSFGKGLYVVAADADFVFTSADGVTWSYVRPVLLANTQGSGVFYGYGAFATLTPSGKVLSSLDGIHWNVEGNTGDSGFTGYGGAVGNGVFCVCGGTTGGSGVIYTSPLGYSPSTQFTLPIPDTSGIPAYYKAN